MGRKTAPKSVSLGQLIAVAAATISVIFLLAFGGQIIEIYRLRSALGIADEGVEKLRAEQASLEATLAYVRTDEYVEQVARAELNRIRPGDHRMVIVTRAAPAPTATPTPPPGSPAAAPCFRLWWELLFGE